MAVHLKAKAETGGHMRNQPCYCGSGLKYKHCHWTEHNTIPEGRVSWKTVKIMLKDTIYQMKKGGTDVGTEDPS